MRVNGDRGALPLECINPPKDRWAVRWGFRDEEVGISYEESIFDHKPTLEEIRAVIGEQINNSTEKEIRGGYVWRDIPVWLSTENQLNYKTAYDLAVQTAGASLPVTFKLGSTEEPVYYTFDVLEEFAEFFTGAVRHINNALAEGWRLKDGIDPSLFGG